MSVKPILFNSAMVRAILEGRKTVTRRIVKPANAKKAAGEAYRQGQGLWIDLSADNGDREGHIKDYSVSPCWCTLGWYVNRYVPYRPGDVLWVRETWAYGCTFATEHKLFYRADGDSDDVYRWRPSIHMPREAARIWLRVTDVRVERLQEIDEDGAIAEGLYKGWRLTQSSSLAETARQAFMWLWLHLARKAPDEMKWSANPWVWVIEFERCEKPEEA